MQRKLLLISLFSLVMLEGCTVNKTLQATGGSCSDGTVKLSYEYVLFETPKIQLSQGKTIATLRCRAWGYENAKRFGGSVTKCQARDGYGNCIKFFVTIEYQCLGSFAENSYRYDNIVVNNYSPKKVENSYRTKKVEINYSPERVLSGYKKEPPRSNSIEIIESYGHIIFANLPDKSRLKATGIAIGDTLLSVNGISVNRDNIHVIKEALKEYEVEISIFGKGVTRIRGSNVVKRF